MFRIGKMFSDLHYFIVAEYILFLHLYRNLFQKSIHLLRKISGIPIFYQEKSKRKGNCKYFSDKWSYYLYKKEGFLHWKAQFTIWGPCRKVCAVLQRPWRNAYMQKQVNKVVNMYFLTYKCLNLTSTNLALLSHISSLTFPLTPTSF